MNNVISNFSQILKFAGDYGLPLIKKRAILREYLQSKIIEMVYQEKKSLGLFLVGGTGLRLLRGLDRFSEDLDFDVVKISVEDIEEIVKSVCQKFRKENIDLDYYRHETTRKTYYELRFPHLLFELKISRNTEEKLSIKLDFEFFWQKQTREMIFFNRYGFFATVVTKSIDQVLVEKLVAYLNRRQTQVRDIYDIVWLIAQGAQLDVPFAKANKFNEDLINNAQIKFKKEKSRLQTLETKLIPFLLDEQNSRKINYFGEMMDKILTN